MLTMSANLQSSKSVCIVGAGASGLVALKECIHGGLRPVCYELDTEIGGVWVEKTDGPSNTPGLWPSLFTNTTKYMMTFSDFPPLPGDTPYLTAQALRNYYKRYALKFDLIKYIQFSTRVIKIQKCSDDIDTGRWQVFTCPTKEFQNGDKRAGHKAMDMDLKKCQVDIFDYVLICSGYFKIPKYPDIPGLETFKGRTSHSFHYVGNNHTKNKIVLIIGNGFSAGDIASDVAANAKQVYLSVGDGTWMVPLISSTSLPFDTCLTRQLQNSSIEDQDNILINECQKRLDHTTAGICPNTPPSQSPFMLSDDIHVKILSGQVKVIGRVNKINGSTIYYNDKHKIVDVDEIIHCTGYDRDFSFIDLNIVQDDGRMEMFKMMFPVHETKHTLGFIGHFASDSAYGPIVELQSRYAVQLFTGRLTLPDKDTMMADINMYNDICLKRRGRYYYMVPSFVFRDSIAKLLGVYPSFWSLLLRDPYLAYQSWYGPSYSAQYRLLGPGSDWTKARETCHTAGREGMKSLFNGENRSDQSHVTTHMTWTKLMFQYFILPAAVTMVFFKFSKTSQAI